MGFFTFDVYIMQIYLSYYTSEITVLRGFGPFTRRISKYLVFVTDRAIYHCHFIAVQRSRNATSLLMICAHAIRKIAPLFRY